jgi:hypothetical protein
MTNKNGTANTYKKHTESSKPEYFGTAALCANCQDVTHTKLQASDVFKFTYLLLLRTATDHTDTQQSM